MTDLLGDTITSPTVAVKSLVNAAWGFVAFWQAYPKGPRKVAKQQCLNRWAKLDCAADATFICQHVLWLKTQDDWLRDNGRFICAPLVYLNQQRWVDWEVVEVKAKPERCQALIDADISKANAMPYAVWLAKQTKVTA